MRLPFDLGVVGDPQRVFRYVHRDDRAAYVRIMRRTFAIQARDLNRAIGRFAFEVGRALLPPLERLAALLTGS